MKVKRKTKDLALEKFNKLELSSLVNSNLEYKSIFNDVSTKCKRPIISFDTLKEISFKNNFKSWDLYVQEDFCRKLVGNRYNELKNTILQ